MPVGALLGAMVSIQLGAALATGLFPALGPAGTTALRVGFGAAILCAAQRPWRGGLARASLPALLGYGASLGCMNLLFYEALARIPLGIAVAVEFCGPLAVAVIESRRPADFAWLALAALGLLLITPWATGPAALDPLGLACALGAGGFWGAYSLFGQRTGRELGARATALGTLIAAAIALPFGVAGAGVALLRPSILPRALGVGLFASALPYFLEMVMLTRMPARMYGTLASLEPALAAFVGWWLLHQELSVRQWAGIAAVIGAALGSANALRSAEVLPQ